MRFRKLRIAWSMAWGVVAVVLCVLWVRSYSLSETGQLSGKRVIYREPPKNQAFYVIHSVVGVVHFCKAGPDPGTYWHVEYAKNKFLGFGARTDWRSICIRIPYYSVVTLTVLLACAPWINWSQSFSVRTLLITTTLIAMGLAIAVWSSGS